MAGPADGGGGRLTENRRMATLLGETGGRLLWGWKIGLGEGGQRLEWDQTR